MGQVLPGGGPAGDYDSPFVLGQNYPNPFAGETTVPFTLPNAAHVQLDIFDLLGRKVASVIRKNLLPGEHSINLNLSGLGLQTGNYVYQLDVLDAHGRHRRSKIMTAA